MLYYCSDLVIFLIMLIAIIIIIIYSVYKSVHNNNYYSIMIGARHCWVNERH